MRLDPERFTPFDPLPAREQLRLSPEAGYGYARTWTEVPVQRAELVTLVPVLPVAVCPDPDADWPVVGLTGVASDVNVFVGPKGGWGGVAVPEAVTTYPFLARLVDSGRGTLCVDPDSDRLSREFGVPLLDAYGAPTDTLAGYRDAAVRQLRERRALARAVAALAEAGVLRPWSAEGVFTLDPERHQYVDLQAVHRLDDATFLNLRRSGALALAFAQRYSLANMRKLRRMEQRRERGRSAAWVEELKGPDDDFELDFSNL